MFLPHGGSTGRSSQKPSALGLATHSARPWAGSAGGPSPGPTRMSRSVPLMPGNGPVGGPAVPSRRPVPAPSGLVQRSTLRSLNRCPGMIASALERPPTTAATTHGGGGLSISPRCRVAPRPRGGSAPGGGGTAGKRAGQPAGSRRARSGRASTSRCSGGKRPPCRPCKPPAGRSQPLWGGAAPGGPSWCAAGLGAWGRRSSASGSGGAASRWGPQSATRAGGTSGAQPSGPGRRRRVQAASWPPSGAPSAAVGRRASR